MPRWTISKEFHFSASHQLTHLLPFDPDHPCARLHGHNYIVRVFLSAEALDKYGFIIDYNDLRMFQKSCIDDFVDHRHLNDVFGCSEGTTAEALAEYFFHTLESYLLDIDRGDVTVVAIEIQETPKTCARYESHG